MIATPGARRDRWISVLVFLALAGLWRDPVDDLHRRSPARRTDGRGMGRSCSPTRSWPCPTIGRAASGSRRSGMARSGPISPRCCRSCRIRSTRSADCRSAWRSAGRRPASWGWPSPGRAGRAGCLTGRCNSCGPCRCSPWCRCSSSGSGPPSSARCCSSPMASRSSSSPAPSTPCATRAPIYLDNARSLGASRLMLLPDRHPAGDLPGPAVHHPRSASAPDGAPCSGPNISEPSRGSATSSSTPTVRLSRPHVLRGAAVHPLHLDQLLGDQQALRPPARLGSSFAAPVTR